MQRSSEQPLVGEERYVTTLITAAKETILLPSHYIMSFCVVSSLTRGGHLLLLIYAEI